MPRRTFFRSASDKKSTRKHQKYDQQIQSQQQQINHRKEQQVRYQQVQHGQVPDRLQASSSTTGSQDPPPNLNGPARTAPKHSLGEQPYNPYYGAHDPLQESYGHHPRIPQYQDQSYGYQHSVDQHQFHQSAEQCQFQHNADQHQFQESVERHHHFQQNTVEQEYFNEHVQIGRDQLQQQHGIHQHHLSQQQSIQGPVQSYEQNVVPTVESATDRMWQCGTGDFRSGSLAIQLLRLAVVTDWERRQQDSDTNIDQLISFPYDPSETFLSLQGAALRFHANFDTMRADRDAYTGEVEGPDSLEWELTEQTAWEIWEESLRATAALAHASVGPGWRYQLQLRRRLNQEAELRSIYGSSLHQRNRVVFDDLSDGGSSLGSYSFDVSNPQSSHYSQRWISPGTEPFPDAVESFRVLIPEVLPAAMVRFAASVIDCTPTLKSAESKIIWKEDQTQQQMQSMILQLINEERRWIRRIKRLGDTQRDLSFALFCVGEGASSPNQDPNNQHQEPYEEWSIPRIHLPMGTMICSWLTCCTIGWPVPKVFDEVPCRFEEVYIQPSADTLDIEETDSPPTEIILPARKCELNENLEPVPPDNEPQTPNEQITSNGVQVKFSLWSDLVSLSRKDWWYTLRVLRDVSDLVSSGWCPPPSGVGNKICRLLVAISMEGLFPILDSSQEDILPDEEICRESCAAESLALLKNLASRDTLPLESVELITSSLCRLLSASEKALSAITNADSVNSPKATMEEEIIIQRTFVASNSAELLWILLSTESTCCPTCDALLNLIDKRLVPGNDGADESGAVSAVRALSAALWGDPPAVKGVPLLRYFWEYIIDILGEALQSSAEMCNKSSISFALEIVLALRRLVDSEMVYGNGDLHPTEWESFRKALDVGISPWLDASKLENEDMDELSHEISALFTQIRCFLAKVPEMENGFHPIVDEDASHILRQCVPRLNAEEASGLSIAAIKSWSFSIRSNLPSRDGKWLRHAISFVSEAFATYEGDCKSAFPGGHVHSALARLEALQSLISDHGHSDQSMMDSASVATSISGITSGTGLSGSMVPVFSLFTLTRNLRDLHLELVNKLLLPQLLEILAPEYEMKGTKPMPVTQISPPTSSVNNAAKSFDYVAEYAEAEFLLLKFSVRTIGLLFKSRSGDGEKRMEYIALLKHIAVSKPHVLSTWAPSNSRSLTERLELETFRLQLEAIRQLELCLQAPFRELPHTHATVPAILNAVCEIVTNYSTKRKDHHTDPILCLAAIIPLARLSCTRNGQGALIRRERVTFRIPEVILSVLEDDGWIECCSPMVDINQSLPMVAEEECFDADNSDDIAPFVYVNQCQSMAKNQDSDVRRNDDQKRRIRRHSNQCSDKTIIEIEPISSVIKETLCAHEKEFAVIRLISFNALSSFLSHGILFPNPKEDMKWLGVEAESIEELVARSEAVSLLATIIGNVLISKRITVQVGEAIIIQTCKVLVRLVIEQSEHWDVVKNSCYGLVTILASMRRKTRKDDGQNKVNDSLLTDTLTPLIGFMCDVLGDEDLLPGSILIPLSNVTRQCINYMGFKKSRALCQRILLTCLTLDKRYPWHLQVIIFFMGAELIDFMSDDLALFLTLGIDKDRSRIQPLLIDVLRSKILYQSFQQWDGIITHREPIKVHEQLARKTIAIETYPFQADGAAAWKCGGSLLTIRIGSTNSLYHGWVEIVHRTASSTTRRIVRCDKEVSAKNPDNLLPFWGMIRTPTKDNLLKEGSVTSVSNPKRHHTDGRVKDEDARQLYADAKSLLKLFDQIIEDGPEASEQENNSLSKSSDSLTLGSRADSFSSSHQELRITTNSVFKSRKLKRNVSDGNMITQAEDCSEDLQGSDVLLWMKNRFDRYFDTSYAMRALEELGFSQSSLGLAILNKEPTVAFYHDKMRPCKTGANFTRALNILDRATPFQTHRVSLLYGGPFSQKSSQKSSNSNAGDGDQFLLATQASPDFWQFAEELGDMVPVRHLRYFSGGLDTSESSSDGSLAIVWFQCKGNKNNDEGLAIVDSMVMFHTVTLMPNKITNRKRHVGNDIVHIIYGIESELLDVDHERLSISGHFGFVTIYVIPFVCIDMVKISIHLKKGLDSSICSALSHLVGSRVVSRKISAETVRALAMEADLICLSMIEEKLGLVLNIEERLLKLNEMSRHLSK